MLHRILGISTLVAIGSLALSPIAKAQPFAVPFSGTVEANCEETSMTPGTLQLNGSGTGLTTDSFGYITITCNTPANYSIDAVEQLGGPPEPSGVSKTAIVTNTSNLPSEATWVNGPVESGRVIAEDNEMEVQMSVDWGGAMPAGTYDYEVRFSVAAP